MAEFEEIDFYPHRRHNQAPRAEADKQRTTELIIPDEDCSVVTLAEAQETVLEALEKKAEELKAALRPWMGMTLNEALDSGFGEEQMRMQSELWTLGAAITRAKNKAKQVI